jgi:hypothetical protein
MARIFISYKRTNKEKVFPIVKQIEEHLGIKCWVDLDGIESSAQFASVICKAIDVADVVLFMHSFVHLDIDFESDWTIKELNYAQAKKKRIVLVKLDSAPLDNIFLMDYGSMNNIDSTDPVQLSKLISDLRIWLALPQTNVKVQEEPEATKLVLFDNRELFSINESNKIRYGFKDEQGSIIIPCIWKNAYSFRNGLAMVQNENGLWGFINKTGREIVPCKWVDAREFSENLALVKKKDNRKYGFVDRKGEIVIPCRWDDAGSFHEGMAFVRNDKGEYGYINNKGDIVIACEWDDAFDFSEGFAGVRGSNYKWGYINRIGELVILCKWKLTFGFHEGLARVTNDHEKYGFIDKTGKIVIPIDLSDAGDFSGGVARVNYGEYIDKTGRVVISREEGRKKEDERIWKDAFNSVKHKFDFSFMKLPEKERLKLLREGLDTDGNDKK